MRAVTANPPKMLTLASATAISPSHRDSEWPALDGAGAACVTTALSATTTPVGVISLAAAICAAGVAECGATDKAPAALAINAPTMITDEIALVTAINGVCNAGVTDHTT